MFPNDNRLQNRRNKTNTMIQNGQITVKKVEKMGVKKDISANSEGKEANETKMALGRTNYVMMLAGLGLIIAGFLLMAGGGSDDPAMFNEKMFSFRRITLAPIVVIAGFVLEVYAIMSRRKI